MGFGTIKASIKDYRISLLVIVGFLILIQDISGGPVRTEITNKINRNFCRNHIFSPRCRGQQKRDVSNHGEDYRLAPPEELDRPHELTALLSSPTIFGEMLRKVIETSPEYDDSNYIK